MLPHEIPLRITTVLLGLIGVIANSISLVFFIKRHSKRLGDKLLKLLNSGDLILSIAVVATAITYQMYLNKGGNGAKISYYVFSFCYGVSIECTGFITCLISITRTIKVCRPFFSISGAWLAVSVISYFIFSFGREFTIYYLLVIRPVENLEEVRKYYCGFFSIIPTLDVILVASSSIITAYWLLNRSNQGSINTANNTHATITILILSVVFFVVNGLFASAAIVQLLIRTGNIEPNLHLYTYKEIVIGVAPCFNSAINPIIYMTRKEEMREFVQEIWRSTKDRLSSTDYPLSRLCKTQEDATK